MENYPVRPAELVLNSLIPAVLAFDTLRLGGRLYNLSVGAWLPHQPHAETRWLQHSSIFI